MYEARQYYLFGIKITIISYPWCLKVIPNVLFHLIFHLKRGRDSLISEFFFKTTYQGTQHTFFYKMRNLIKATTL